MLRDIRTSVYNEHQLVKSPAEQSYFTLSDTQKKKEERIYFMQQVSVHSFSYKRARPPKFIKFEA